MSEDLIRRSDAIKAIEAEELLGYVECQVEWLYDRINAIPSANRPQDRATDGKEQVMKILVDSMPEDAEACAFADICWRNDEWEPYCTLDSDGVSECDLKDGQCSFLKALEERSK